jgi:hypothetical protein
VVGVLTSDDGGSNAAVSSSRRGSCNNNGRCSDQNRQDDDVYSRSTVTSQMHTDAGRELGSNAKRGGI